jgi:subtilase family serine protease
MSRRAAGILTLTTALLTLATSAPAATAKPASRVWFPRNMLGLRNATNLGAPAPSRVMQVGIGLKDPHTAAELGLLRAQQTPGSPEFHRFLTPAQFDSRFGVSKASFANLLAWLLAGGVHVLDTAGARNFIEISAAVSQVDKLFQTHISSYTAKGAHFLANSSAPSVPAHLDVLTMMGLNTLAHPTTPLAGAVRAAARDLGEVERPVSGRARGRLRTRGSTGAAASASRPDPSLRSPVRA